MTKTKKNLEAILVAITFEAGRTHPTKEIALFDVNRIFPTAYNLYFV